jgi:thiol-disulfide isomerase/thioredoxin
MTQSTRFLSCIAALMLGVISLSAGTVTLLPTAPRQGGEVVVEYVPGEADAGLLTKGGLHAVVYTFSSDAESPVAYEIPLKKGNARWSGSLKLAQSVVYGIVKIGNGSAYDTNKDMYWEFLCSSERGGPVEGAHLRAGMARYGQLPKQCRMSEDFEGAMEEIDAEVRAYPSNMVARINSIMLMKNLGTLEEAEAIAKAREITTSIRQVRSPLEAIAIAQAYEMQGRSEDAQKVMMDAGARFPRSIVEEQIALSKLGAAQSADQFMQMASDHLKAWPDSYARQNLVNAVIDAAMKQRTMHQLARFFEQTPGLYAMSYHQAVNYVGAVDSLQPSALALVDAGIKAATNSEIKPPAYGTSEWNEEQRIATSELRFVEGAILRARKQTDKAIASLEQSCTIGGTQTEKGCYEMLIGLYRDQQLTEKAQAMAELAIRQGASTQGILEAYRMILAQSGLDSVEINKRETALRQSGRTVLAQRVVREMLNQPLIDGTFATLDGAPMKISDWKGKVVIIDYWATWCGPCRQSFPSLQKLYERYKTNPNVAFAVVNVWERSDDRAKTVLDFLKANATLTFPMYIDEKDEVVRKYGVTGIPTKFYLGKDGRVQFKEVGFTPEEQFLEDATTRIEALLAQ